MRLRQQCTPAMTLRQRIETYTSHCHEYTHDSVYLLDRSHGFLTNVQVQTLAGSSVMWCSRVELCQKQSSHHWAAAGNMIINHTGSTPNAMASHTKLSTLSMEPIRLTLPILQCPLYPKMLEPRSLGCTLNTAT